MRGRVRNFKNVKGYGFACDEAGNEHFVHPDDIVHGMKEVTGLDVQFLLDGAEIEFDVVETSKGKQAINVRMLDSGPMKYVVHEDARRATLVSGTVIFTIREDGSLKLSGETIDPMFEADGLRIYRMGDNLIQSFSARLPKPTANKVHFFVDGRITGRNSDGSLERNLRQPQSDGVYFNLRPGDFLVSVERSGRVEILGFGARGYHSAGENYLVIEGRFSHTYKLSGTINRESLLALTPSDSDNKRTNDVFVRAILRGLMTLEEMAGSVSIPPKTETATLTSKIAVPTPQWVPK